MKNKEDILQILSYLQTVEEKALDFDEEAIIAAYQNHQTKRSIVIKIVSTLGGLLSSIAFSIFIVLTGLNNSGISTVLGVLCIATALWVTISYDKAIIDTLSLAFFVTGFVLLDVGLIDLHEDRNIISIIFIIIACGTLGMVRNYLLCFMSVLIINGNILFLISNNHADNLIHIHVAALVLLMVFLFLKEATFLRAGTAFSKLYNPVRTGLIFFLLCVLFLLGNKTSFVRQSADYFWLSSLAIIPAIVYLISTLFPLLNISKRHHQIIVLSVSSVVLLPTALAPTISAALLLILLSFKVNYKTGLVLGIIAFVYFVWLYYYDLHFTLLTKSILLFSSGLLFIILYLLTYKRLASDEKI